MTKEDFLRVLAENEDDADLRLIFADWLDEQGEYEEADRQRGWLAAKQWLVRFARTHSTDWEEYTYDNLVSFGRRASASDDQAARIHLDEPMWSALKENIDEFWKNWSVVTGLPSPSTSQGRGFQRWVCCAHEIYYWFGLPDPEDSDDAVRDA
jgi:uncharacterized protein (TIGR02996 family)